MLELSSNPDALTVQLAILALLGLSFCILILAVAYRVFKGAKTK